MIGIEKWGATMDEPATVIDVARAAGVSHTTVSDALNGTGRISEQRRAEIVKIAEAMQYHPRIAARLMRGNRTGQIGLILGTAAKEIAPSAIWSSVLVSFVQSCETESIPYHIEFCSSSTDGSFKGPRQFNGRLVDGALVIGFLDNPIGAWLAKQSRYPWVGLADSADYCVLMDMAEGVYGAVQHLAALGHRRIAFGFGPTLYHVHGTGLAGFQRGQRDFQLDACCETWKREFWRKSMGPQSASDFADAVGWARQLFAETPRPTAFLCHDMRIARAVIFTAMEKGLRIPQDVSVIAHGTATDAEKALPFLSALEADYSELVGKALAMLRRRIAGKPVPAREIRVGARLVMRETVAAPRG